MSPSSGPSVFIVGAGRLGRALAVALRAADSHLLGTWNRTPGAAARTRRICGGPAHSGRLPSRVRAADLVLLTVRDDAVPSMAARLVHEAGVGTGQVVAHCAGGLGLAPLAACAEAGAAVGSLHPLRAFTDPAVDARRLPGTACVLDGDPRALPYLSSLAERLKLRAVLLPKTRDARRLYHAGAVCAAGHLTALMATALDLVRHAGLDPALALPGILSLARGTLDAIEAAGTPAPALTGPVARGDVETIEAHRQALRERAPDALPVYDALTEASRRLVLGLQDPQDP